MQVEERRCPWRNSFLRITSIRYYAIHGAETFYNSERYYQNELC